MATIIVQGTKEENAKALSALKSQFLTVNKKGTTSADTGTMSIYDVYLESDNGREYSDIEIELGLKCHSNATQDCASCPFKKVENCKDVLLTEGSLYIQRLMLGSVKNED